MCVIRDFGFDSQIVELTISRHSERSAPTVHRKLTVTIENRSGRHCLMLINPEPLADLSSLMDAWGFRILDLNRDEAVGLEFGRYWLEYRDDDDAPSEHIQADRIEQMNDVVD